MAYPQTREERLAKLRSEHEAGSLYPDGPDIDLLLTIIDADREKLKAPLAAERTLARAQRIIGNLHIERAELIERIGRLVEAQDAEAESGANPQ